MDMQEQIAGIRTECLQALDKVSSLNELEQLRVSVLGKKGSLTGLLRGMGQVDPALRPTVERTQQGHNRTAIAEVLGKSCGAVTYRRGKARRLGLLAARQTSTAGAAA